MTSSSEPYCGLALLTSFIEENKITDIDYTFDDFACLIFKIKLAIVTAVISLSVEHQHIELNFISGKMVNKYRSLSYFTFEVY